MSEPIRYPWDRKEGYSNDRSTTIDDSLLKTLKDMVMNPNPYGPSMPSVAPPEWTWIETTDSSGKATFEQECGKCHSLKYAQDVTYSREEWEITVAMMRSNGAQFTDEQKLVIIDYLTAKSLLETKCSVCHPVDRPLSKAKSIEDWKATVTRMSGKKPGHLSEEDIAQIAAFLAVERPAQ